MCSESTSLPPACWTLTTRSLQRKVPLCLDLKPLAQNGFVTQQWFQMHKNIYFVLSMGTRDRSKGEALCHSSLTCRRPISLIYFSSFRLRAPVCIVPSSCYVVWQSLEVPLWCGGICDAALLNTCNFPVTSRSTLAPVACGDWPPTPTCELSLRFLLPPPSFPLFHNSATQRLVQRREIDRVLPLSPSLESHRVENTKTWSHRVAGERSRRKCDGPFSSCLQVWPFGTALNSSS